MKFRMRTCILFLLFCVCVSNANSQINATVAGSAVASFSGRTEAAASPEQGAILGAIKVWITAFGDIYFIVSKAHAKISAEISVIFLRRFAADIIINDQRQIIGKNYARVITIRVCCNSDPNAYRSANTDWAVLVFNKIKSQGMGMGSWICKRYNLWV